MRTSIYWVLVAEPLAEPDGVVTEPEALVELEGVDDVADESLEGEVVLGLVALEEGAGVVVLGVTTVVESREAVVAAGGFVVVVEEVWVRSHPARAAAPSARAATRGVSFMCAPWKVGVPDAVIGATRREFARAHAKSIRARVLSCRDVGLAGPFLRGGRDRIRAPMAGALETLDAIYRSESRRVLATLIRLLGDFDVAEEALHDAFAAAVEQWPADGVPDNPRAWLVSAGRFKAIDRLRRRSRHDVPLEEVEDRLEAASGGAQPGDNEGVEDDRLRLIFTCCHPALAPEAQVALTLREVCGMTTEEIARAYLSAPATVAQRIVRAKAKIRDARIPYEVPGRGELGERLESVLRVIYLVFNEGYLASSGEALTRHELSAEAIRLGRLLVELLPEPEAVGLLALMLLQESRRAARATADGELVLLADQDRSSWNREQIADGTRLVQAALAAGRVGPYTLQAAIAAVHAAAPTAADTDWGRIVALYDALLRIDPSPVVELNRAVAVSMRDGPEAALALVDELLARGDLDDYRFAHATRADLFRRIGRAGEARAAYRRALELTQQASERRFIERRLAELEG